MKRFFGLFALAFLAIAFGCQHGTEDSGTTNGEIVISSVTVAGQPCAENATIEVDNERAEVIATFAESYAGLTVKIAGNPATVTGKVAKLTVESITETAKAIKIEAKATGKNDKTFNFSVKKVLPIASILKLTFEGKEINPKGTGYYGKDQKIYYASSAPLLSEIASDGSTKIGDVREPKVNILVGYKDGVTGQKLKIENTTTGASDETTRIVGWKKSIELGIGLKLGDNNLTITYSEQGKGPLVYKVIVGYGNPNYDPIYLIKIIDSWYNTKEKFQALEAGNETLSVEGAPVADVKITMTGVWYEEDGWKLTLDGKDVEKRDFVKGGFSTVTYSIEKKVDLTKDGTKELKIIFENPIYSYKKTYKVSITHVSVNKIASIISIDAKNKVLVDTNLEANYSFEQDKNYYKAKDSILFNDRVEKGTFLITPQDDAIIPKYAFSDTEVDTSTISTWQVITKKEITYSNTYNKPITVNTYAIEEQNLKYEGQFLYILLEKDGVKTYYVTEIKREKVANNNAEKEKEEKIYQKENGEKIGDTSPISKKGKIRVLPKSPRAKVKLLTPREEDFILNASDGYYECSLDLIDRETPFSYKIVAEDSSTEVTYQGSFVKSVVIKDFRFDYKRDGLTWQREFIDEFDGNYYLSFDKEEVKENKLYLFISAYKGVEITCADFAESTKKDEYTATDYTIVLDVASLMNGTDKKKEYTATIALEGEALPQLHLTVYPQDDIIKGMYVGGMKCIQLPDDKYVRKADIDSNRPRKIAVDLWFTQNEDATNTTRKIRLLKEGEEKTVTINKNETSALEFEHEGLIINDKDKMTFIIEYYANKDDPSPARTYTLEIEDI